MGIVYGGQLGIYLFSVHLRCYRCVDISSCGTVQGEVNLCIYWRGSRQLSYKAFTTSLFLYIRLQELVGVLLYSALAPTPGVIAATIATMP